MNFIVASKSI